MAFILIALGLIKHPHHEPKVVPEALIITSDFDAVFVPEGFEGPVVAIPADGEVF
jgi:hypothetical protein